ANASRFDMVASGFGFGEPWHYDINNINKTPPNSGGGTPAKKGKVMNHYHTEDKDSRSKGRSLQPGAGFYIHTAAGRASSQASNLTKEVGKYLITLHVYATGTPGDVVEVYLMWQNTKSKPVSNSTH